MKCKCVADKHNFFFASSAVGKLAHSALQAVHAPCVKLLGSCAKLMGLCRLAHIEQAKAALVRVFSWATLLLWDLTVAIPICLFDGRNTGSHLQTAHDILHGGVGPGHNLLNERKQNFCVSC